MSSLSNIGSRLEGALVLPVTVLVGIIAGKLVLDFIGNNVSDIGNSTKKISDFFTSFDWGDTTLNSLSGSFGTIAGLVIFVAIVVMVVRGARVLTGATGAHD